MKTLIRSIVRSCYVANQAWSFGELETSVRLLTALLDPDILLWCEQNAFILVTNNRKSMPAHLQNHLAQGWHVPGILVMNPRMSVGETIDELVLIWGTSEEVEYLDRISFLPVSS